MGRTGLTEAMSETAEEMESRLLGVISRARFEAFADVYVWAAMMSGEAPRREAIVCVRRPLTAW